MCCSTGTHNSKAKKHSAVASDQDRTLTKQSTPAQRRATCRQKNSVENGTTSSRYFTRFFSNQKFNSAGYLYVGPFTPGARFEAAGSHVAHTHKNHHTTPNS